MSSYRVPTLSRTVLDTKRDVLDCWGYYNKNTIDCVAYKQQNFISNSSGGWRIQDQGAGRYGVR